MEHSRWKDVHQRGLAGKTLRDERDPFTHADGRVQWLSWEVRHWHDADGAVGGIFIVSEDITAKVKAARRAPGSSYELCVVRRSPDQSSTRHFRDQQ